MLNVLGENYLGASVSQAGKRESLSSVQGRADVQGASGGLEGALDLSIGSSRVDVDFTGQLKVTALGQEVTLLGSAGTLHLDTSGSSVKFWRTLALTGCSVAVPRFAAMRAAAARLAEERHARPGRIDQLVARRPVPREGVDDPAEGEGLGQERLGEDRLDGLGDAVLEVAVLPSARIERQQAIAILLAHGAPERLRGQPVHDRRRTRGFVVFRQRAAREHASAARRVADTRHAMWSNDVEAAKVRECRDAGRRAKFRVGHRVVDRRDQVVDQLKPVIFKCG